MKFITFCPMLLCLMSLNYFWLILKRDCDLKEYSYTIDIVNKYASVVDYLKHDMHAHAIKKYQAIHKCNILTAKHMVDKIKQDMKNLENQK